MVVVAKSCTLECHRPHIQYSSIPAEDLKHILDWIPLSILYDSCRSMSSDMDTDEGERIVSSAPSASGLIITLHPLVIMNMSDQWTRTKMQTSNPNPQVIGALLGIQTGREIEIFDSFELPFTDVEGSLVIDKAYFAQKQEQLKQVFPKFELMGWYSTGSNPSAQDVVLHQQVTEFNESPLFLQLNPVAPANSKEFPISIYEPNLTAHAQLTFTKSQYKIETGEAERIAVDHVAHIKNETSEKTSTLTAALVGQKNAIKMLHSRVQIICHYVNDVRSGSLPMDHNVMRQISSLTSRLPTIESPDFGKEVLMDFTDVLLMSYLASITRGTHSVAEVSEKFNIIGPKRPASHTRGLGAYLG
ncbi:maintenance of mitochondrial structure and function-domain-containing protein [Phlyctochytrium arcticum]|nr:maintenance of mitochondrial structure and function-domain-containing protein [Phlyctochytrium arcticum]